MQQYRDGKGVTYTEALAGAIPQLNGEDKGRKARDALSERLTRMKAEVLARYLQDPDAEIRRAAALAAAMKEAKTLIPDDPAAVGRGAGGGPRRSRGVEGPQRREAGADRGRMESLVEKSG